MARLFDLILIYIMVLLYPHYLHEYVRCSILPRKCFSYIMFIVLVLVPSMIPSLLWKVTLLITKRIYECTIQDIHAKSFKLKGLG